MWVRVSRIRNFTKFPKKVLLNLRLWQYAMKVKAFATVWGKTKLTSFYGRGLPGSIEFVIDCLRIILYACVELIVSAVRPKGLSRRWKSTGGHITVLFCKYILIWICCRRLKIMEQSDYYSVTHILSNKVHGAPIVQSLWGLRLHSPLKVNLGSPSASSVYYSSLVQDFQFITIILFYREKGYCNNMLRISAVYIFCFSIYTEQGIVEYGHWR